MHSWGLLPLFGTGGSLGRAAAFLHEVYHFVHHIALHTAGSRWALGLIHRPTGGLRASWCLRAERRLSLAVALQVAGSVAAAVAAGSRQAARAVIEFLVFS